MPQEVPFWDSAYDVANPGPYVGPTYMVNVWDSGTIAGTVIPGIVSVTIAPARHLDIVTKPGIAPYVNVLGYEPTRFSMQIKIWTPAQWQKLQPIMWRLMPDLPGYGKPPQVRNAKGKLSSVSTTFDIFHAKLVNMGVSSATCLKMGDLAGDQVKTLSLEFLANRKGKSAILTIEEAGVAAPYNATTLSNQANNPSNGPAGVFTPTQGPQQTPSSSGITLRPTTP